MRSRSWRRQPEKLGCQQKTVCTMVQPDDWWQNKSGEDVAVVNILLNIVTCPTYPEEFIRDMLLHRLCDRL